jgi:hypothetical protein
MSDKISHHCVSHPLNEPERRSEPQGEGVGRARMRNPGRRTASAGLLLGGCLAALQGLGACGDRRIIFCENGFDATAHACNAAAGAGGAGGGGGAGGSAGTSAGASGTGGTTSPGGAAGAAAGGTGGSAGASSPDASVPSDAGDAGGLDAAVAP